MAKKKSVPIKVPIELSIEDLMIHEAKKGAERFRYETRILDREQLKAALGKDWRPGHIAGWVFVLTWKIGDKQKSTNLYVRNGQEHDHLKKTLRDFTRTMNKRIKAGEFKKKAKKVTK